MLPPVTDDSSRCTKPTKDVCLNELVHNLVIIGLGCYSLYLLGNIVHRHQNILTSERKWKRSHQVDSPNVKDFNNQDGVQRHHIPLGHCSKALASITCPTKIISIFEQGRPEEYAL